MKIKNDQSGFAAIVVALVLILVLSLTTVGFAELMSSNQKEALNKQLSSQAYYAAESGVNDAIQAYAKGYTYAKTECGGNFPGATGDSSYSETPSVNTTTNTDITCLLTNPNPSSIIYTISNTQPTVIEIQGCSQNDKSSPISQCNGYSPEPISTINISWYDGGSNLLTGLNANKFPSANNINSNYSNILRIELVPLSGSLSRSALISNAYTAYLEPNGSAASASSDSVTSSNTGENSGEILSSNCPTGFSSTTGVICNVNLNVSTLSNSSTYLLVLRSIYSYSTTAIATIYDSSDKALNIGDAQLLIDSTGKAQNILKRIQVRVSETNEFETPDAVVHGLVCKQLNVLPSGTVGSSDSSSECNVTR